jgi:hypothetical protein
MSSGKIDVIMLWFIVLCLVYFCLDSLHWLNILTDKRDKRLQWWLCFPYDKDATSLYIKPIHFPPSMIMWTINEIRHVPILPIQRQVLYQHMSIILQPRLGSLEVYTAYSKWKYFNTMICSTCRKHFPVLSSFMIYHRVCT